MPTTCVINACTYNKRKGDKRRPTGVSIHMFPSDLELKKLWIEFVMIQNKKEYNHRPHHRLCSQHFSPDSFIGGSLKFRSVPTEFHFRYDTSEDGWCDKPELVFGPNFTAQTSKSILLNPQYQNNRFIEEETQIDNPVVCVLDPDDTLPNKNIVNNGIVLEQVRSKTSLTSATTSQIQQPNEDNKLPCVEILNNDPSLCVFDEESTIVISCTDRNEFPQDPLRIENSTTNTIEDGSPGLSNSSSDVSMSDAVNPENPVKSSTLADTFIYSPEEIASLLSERGRKRFINDFTESDFDTPLKRARNVQRIKNIVQDLQQKLRNARKTASRWKKKAASLQNNMQELEES